FTTKSLKVQHKGSLRGKINVKHLKDGIKLAILYSLGLLCGTLCVSFVVKKELILTLDSH
ncbi:MAG: hypothetical protein KAG99_00240, partial [Bacteroidales bacterium]|nr:hypothetical protein [Bacteroidales bacterium]